jgi:hypothetical protein
MEFHKDTWVQLSKKTKDALVFKAANDMVAAKCQLSEETRKWYDEMLDVIGARYVVAFWCHLVDAFVDDRELLKLVHTRYSWKVMAQFDNQVSPAADAIVINADFYPRFNKHGVLVDCNRYDKMSEEDSEKRPSDDV